MIRRKKMKIHHLDKYPLGDRNSTYGGNSGDKEGILVKGEYWIIKYPKSGSMLKNVDEMSYAQTPESEYIGSHVYKILGYPVHQTALGIRNGHVVVACKDFCDNEHRLIEFRQLKNTYNKILNEKLNTSLSPTGSDHFTNLNEIMIHFKYNPALQEINGLEERFWECLIIDGLINNNDRNNGNWGILRGPDGDSLAPIYDNGGSFSPNVPEKKIIKKLNVPELLRQSVHDGITAYSLDGEKNARFRDIIVLDIPELKKAIKKVVPLIKEHLPEIYKMIDEIPETFEEHNILSKERKLVYKEELTLRLEMLLIPQYEKIIENEQNNNIPEKTEMPDQTENSRNKGGYGEIGD